IFRVSPAGREVVVRVLGPGRTFADPAVFDDGPLPASAAAVDPSVVGVLPTRDVFALIDSHPRGARAVLRLLSERIPSFAQLVEEGATRDIVTRVAALLLDVARGRGPLVEDNAPGSLQLTHQSVAAMIGSVREVVQRALKLLESAGTVKLSRGRIHIADRRVLERWSEMPGRRSDLRGSGARGGGRRLAERFVPRSGETALLVLLGERVILVPLAPGKLVIEDVLRVEVQQLGVPLVGALYIAHVKIDVVERHGLVGHVQFPAGRVDGSRMVYHGAGHGVHAARPPFTRPRAWANRTA